MNADRKSLRVLMTADTVGGVWTYAIELMRALPDIEFTLATMGAPLSDSQTEEIAELRNVRVRDSSFKLEWMDDPWADVDRAGEWLLQIASEVQPDFIHLNGYSHATLGWNAPVLVVAHSCVISWWRAVKGEAAPSRYDEYRRRVMRGLSAADLVVAPTAAMLDSLRDNYDAGFAGRVIPNGRNHERFSPAPKSHKIFAAGRVWDEGKNVALLNAIAPRLAWPVEIAGEDLHPGGARSPLANVKVHGKIGGDELARHLATSAIYVAPALYEPFGLAILEAALAGCALVLADIPSLRELWNDAAVFASPRDADAFVRTCDALIGNAVRREEMGLRARQRGLQFTVGRMADSYRDAYGACLKTEEVPA